MSAPPIIARVDPALSASLGAMVPLTGEHGHVRAGSGIRRWAGRIVVIQDDVHTLALLDEQQRVLGSLALAGSGRSADRTVDKRHKMDLEACVVLPDGRLLALGSGSTAMRERLVLVTPELDVRIVDGHALYAQLRERVDFAGSELNIEGAVVVAGGLRLFQRGNGAPARGLEPVDATGDLDLVELATWLGGGRLPELRAVRQYELGRVDGIRFGFTDAALLPDGRIGFLAGAEDSPDTYQDGVVVGCRFGVIDDGVRVTDIVDTSGTSSRLKLEGIEWRGRVEGGEEFFVVADMDDPDLPALMGVLTVSG